MEQNSDQPLTHNHNDSDPRQNGGNSPVTSSNPQPTDAPPQQPINSMQGSHVSAQTTPANLPQQPDRPAHSGQTQPVATTNQPYEPKDAESDSSVVVTNLRQRNSGDGWKSALSTILILIAAPLLAILLTTFVFQSYEVDGESMETTLQNNDRLIVWKMPVTISKLTSGDYVPERGEVVVFHRYGTATATGGGDKQLIKRVIGLPGERVVVRDNQITIYNTEHPEGFNPDSSEYGERAQISPGNVDLTVPDGEVFVVGDNRNNSLDSRAFGTISVDDIVGELGARIFPFDKAQVY